MLEQNIHRNKFVIKNLNIYWNSTQALRAVTLDIEANKILAIIGPSGSGKTVFLRALNRLNDLVPEIRIEGKICMDENDLYHPRCNVVALRKKVGIVFALPIALPMSIYDNVVFGPTGAGERNKKRLEDLVEKSLKSAFLWDEVKDRLSMSGLRLSGGQQQRLCLARVLAMEPEVILLDEPCSGLDPISTAMIEQALTELKKNYTIVLVTNNTKQAARVGDNTAFFLMNEMIEYGPTNQIFTNPSDQRTNDYITGRFG